MALPSSVTLGSMALVVAAGVGFVAVTSSAAEDSAPPAASGPTNATPTTSKPTVIKPKPTSTPTKTPPKPVDVVPTVLVEVYNNSGISGLAADKAAALQGAGWNVAATDNWYGDIASNTVYYPDGMKVQATRLAKELRISRLRPAISPMQFDRLTAIFTSAG